MEELEAISRQSSYTIQAYVVPIKGVLQLQYTAKNVYGSALSSIRGQSFVEKDGQNIFFT